MTEKEDKPTVKTINLRKGRLGKAMRVINYGSLNLDYVYQVPHMVQEGETLAASGMETFLGGKGLNQSIALARAGVSVFHAGCVGEDGQILLDYLKQNGVDTAWIQTVEGKSGHTIIQVDASAQNSILLYGGANRKQTGEQIRQVMEQGMAGDYLVLQNEINGIDTIMRNGKEKGMKLVLNPSPIDEAILNAPLEMADYLLVNEIEGSAITGDTEPEAMVHVFRERYPDTALLLTLGTAGAIYADEKELVRQEAIRVKAVDTTAAGDTFTGYFIAGLLENRPMAEIMRRCAAASALAVSRQGAAPSIPKKSEVEEFLLLHSR